MLRLEPGPPHPPVRPSFPTLYHLALPFLRQALRWLGVPAPDLDDVLQDVLIAAYRGLDRYEPVAPATGPEGGWEPLRRWLLGIAWRQVGHYRARAHRRREIPAGAGASWPLHPADPSPSSEHRLAGEQRAALVGRLLDTIAPDRRIVLVFHDLLEVPVPEIARELGVNENTTRNRLRLAREDFRVAFKRMRAEERRALRGPGLSASEPRDLDEPDRLLREARAIPEVPEPVRVALWAALAGGAQ